MKIVIFGAGRLFQQLSPEIDCREVVGIIDNDYTKLYKDIGGVTVVQPERIKEYMFDYVVIFNTSCFDEMRNQLISFGVPSKKIVGWQYYLYILKYHVNVLSRNEFNGICDILSKLELQSILDMEEGIEKNAFYIKNTRLIDHIKNVKIYSSEEKFNPNVYCGNSNIVEEVDAALFLDYFINHSIEEFLSKVKQIKEKVKYLIVSVPYPVCEEWREWSEVDLKQIGEVTLIIGKVLKHIVVKISPKVCDKNSKIYIVSHREFAIPQDPFYEPIYVGEYEPENKGGLRDSAGENISILNIKLNELTAVYWVWKNTHFENIGFCHYRRYFGERSQIDNPYFDILTREQANNYLSGVDMIVANAICTYPRSISKQLKGILNCHAYSTCYKLYIDRIKEICPDYLNDFELVMKGMIMYPCNMFYTRWCFFDAYCSWLFPIVVYVAKKINVDSYDIYSKRVVGFFAERMLTVWILHNHIKVKEMDVISISD